MAIACSSDIRVGSFRVREMGVENNRAADSFDIGCSRLVKMMAGIGCIADVDHTADSFREILVGSAGNRRIV